MLELPAVYQRVVSEVMLSASWLHLYWSLLLPEEASFVGKEWNILESTCVSGLGNCEVDSEDVFGPRRTCSAPEIRMPSLHQTQNPTGIQSHWLEKQLKPVFFTNKIKLKLKIKLTLTWEFIMCLENEKDNFQQQSWLFLQIMQHLWGCQDTVILLCSYCWVFQC